MCVCLVVGGCAGITESELWFKLPPPEVNRWEVEEPLVSADDEPSNEEAPLDSKCKSEADVNEFDTLGPLDQLEIVTTLVTRGGGLMCCPFFGCACVFVGVGLVCG